MTVNNNEAKMYTHHTPSKAIVALDHKVFDGIMMGKRQSMSGFCFDELGVFVPMLKMQMNEKKDSSLYVNDKEKQHLSRSPALFRKKKRNVGQTSSSFRTYVHEEKKNTEGMQLLNFLFVCFVFIYGAFLLFDVTPTGMILSNKEFFQLRASTINGCS